MCYGGRSVRSLNSRGGCSCDDHRHAPDRTRRSGRRLTRRRGGCRLRGRARPDLVDRRVGNVARAGRVQRVRGHRRRQRALAARRGRRRDMGAQRDEPRSRRGAADGRRAGRRRRASAGARVERGPARGRRRGGRARTHHGDARHRPRVAGHRRRRRGGREPRLDRQRIPRRSRADTCHRHLGSLRRGRHRHRPGGRCRPSRGVRLAQRLLGRGGRRRGGGDHGRDPARNTSHGSTRTRSPRHRHPRRRHGAPHRRSRRGPKRLVGPDDDRVVRLGSAATRSVRDRRAEPTAPDARPPPVHRAAVPRLDRPALSLPGWPSSV